MFPSAYLTFDLTFNIYYYRKYDILTATKTFLWNEGLSKTKPYSGARGETETQLTITRTPSSWKNETRKKERR
jgi:hypothetical protein